MGFFFFQAEDGIRDGRVTGVQTCALPISAIPRQYGGQGLGYEMLCCVAGEIGRSMAAVPFGSSILLAAEALLIGGTEEQRRAYLPALASGKKIGAFAIAETAGALAQESIRAAY